LARSRASASRYCCLSFVGEAKVDIDHLAEALAKSCATVSPLNERLPIAAKRVGVLISGSGK